MNVTEVQTGALPICQTSSKVERSTDRHPEPGREHFRHTAGKWRTADRGYGSLELRYDQSCCVHVSAERNGHQIHCQLGRRRVAGGSDRRPPDYRAPFDVGSRTMSDTFDVIMAAYPSVGLARPDFDALVRLVKDKRV